MISENREFSEKKGVACVCVVGKKMFYTNSGDELEGALLLFLTESLSL